MTFKMKPMTDNDLLLPWLEKGEPQAFRQIARAAQLDGASQVREWGDELCPHDYRTLPTRRKHACDKCWDSLKEVGEK